MTLLSIEGLSLDIHGTPILRDVSLRLDAGRTLGVVGESGSGKSLTALATMGLLPAGARATGAIRLDGRNLLGTPEPALCRLRGARIGMIFQEPMTALNPLQRIGDQVAETLVIHGQARRAEARAIAMDRLARVGLSPDRVPPGRFPHELSGGQRQRVCIAMAVALRPALLIADEPTTALDVTTQAQILDLLGRLVAEDDMALMLITHDLAVVAGIADRVAVMQSGRVVEEDDTERLFRAMRHPYTRQLFAASDHRPARRPQPPGAPLLRVAQVCRDYALPRRRPWQPRPTLRAVDGVSLEVRAGESVGLVGESGCGKSTLTRAILGLEPVQSGAIHLEGQPVGPGMPPTLRARVQVVFQDPYGSFNPRHRVARAVAEPFHLAAHPPTGAARRAAVAEALEAVGLSADDMDRYPHEFSGGQRQRLAIARALILRPRLIVLDEAVSALDVSVRARILDLLADLQARFGLSYLFISHDLAVVRAITDRVAVMRAGRIVEEGPTETVFAAPTHPYTRALLAATPRIPAHWTPEGVPQGPPRTGGA
ncbi:MAG: ABC transporter ATP-binding protein [Alkalilacustris sp.]